MDALQAAQAAPPIPATVSKVATSAQTEPKIAAPVHFPGDPEHCRGLLNQCMIYFELTLQRYSSEKSKVAYIMALLQGKALAWASQHTVL